MSAALSGSWVSSMAASAHAFDSPCSNGGSHPLLLRLSVLVRSQIFQWCRRGQLRTHDALTVPQVSNSYEAVGLDAVLLVEYCGCSLSTTKPDDYPKAGCRVDQIHTVLEDLTQAGFSVVRPSQ